MFKKNRRKRLNRNQLITADGAQSINQLSEKAHITLEALNQIAETVGVRKPESGGLLLGPIGRDGISHFVFDEKGSVSPASYSPSHKELTKLCEDAALDGYELKGFCHSHPGLQTPSDGDMRYVSKFFAENSSLRKFYMPILPKVPLGGGNGFKRRNWSKMLEFYVVYRTRPDSYEKVEMIVSDEDDFPSLPVEPVGSLPDVLLKLDINRVARLAGNAQVTPTVVETNGFSIGCLSVQDEDVDVMVIVPAEFPVLSPTVIVTRPGSKSEQYHFRWLMESKAVPEQRLARLIKAAMAGNSRDF